MANPIAGKWGGAGGTNGSGGSGGNYNGYGNGGGGGGGLQGSGSVGSFYAYGSGGGGGVGYPALSGGVAGQHAGTGGFGGGGGGGGGGYSGGGGGLFGGVGGGGGSLDAGSNQLLMAGENAGNGSVTIDLLCYLRGTHILTPTGEVCVEDLEIGDRVVTRFRGIQPIRWIGRQSYAAAFLKSNRGKLPVCIRAGSLGTHLPARDLYVSPGHSMLVDGVLVLACSLVNGVTITQDWCPARIDYFQIELDSHDCVIAEGAWSESYADCEGLREQFHNIDEFHQLYPDYQTPEELSLCAPRPERGAKLDLALRPLVTPVASSLRPGKLRGSVDLVRFPWKIEGWAQDQAHPELPVLLEVMLGSQLIGTVLACDFRSDLLQAGIGQGRCAFAFRSPARLGPDTIGSLQIRRAADGAVVWMSEACIARCAPTQVEPAAPRLHRVA
jgi:hypothetical protein